MSLSSRVATSTPCAVTVSGQCRHPRTTHRADVRRDSARVHAPTAAHQGGWLAGLNDAYVGKALHLLHTKPAHNWTVEELAREVALSRSVLAQRFTELVGETPIRYLASWRMQLAKQMMREGVRNIQEVATRVGYESEAAFNRAFKRATGSPPATWRKGALSAPVLSANDVADARATRGGRSVLS
jgi:AraC family transcriptional regulator, alkane utilization regulator